MEYLQQTGTAFYQNKCFLINSLEPQRFMSEMLRHLWQNSITTHKFGHQWDAKITTGLLYITRTNDWTVLIKKTDIKDPNKYEQN